MKERIKNVVSLTDVDISDEVAGEAREKKAAESMARRQAQIEKLKVENEAIRQRLANAKAVTDDDVLDDVREGGKVIGAARIAMSADSKARKAQAEQQARAVADEVLKRADEAFHSREQLAQARLEAQLKPVAETLANLAVKHG